MANDLTTNTQNSRPALLQSRSTDELRDALTARCDQVRLLRNVRDLLKLYWQPNETEAEQARQAGLFVYDLACFSDEVAGWAITEWRRTQDRRPSIASLRQLCMKRHHDINDVLRYRGTPQGAGESAIYERLSPEELAQRKTTAADILSGLGFAKDGGKWKSAGLIDREREDAAKRARHWSEAAGPDDPRWVALRKSRAENALTRSAAP